MNAGCYGSEVKDLFEWCKVSLACPPRQVSFALHAERFIFVHIFLCKDKSAEKFSREREHMEVLVIGS